ncbi:MAG: SPOR domain-containing protein [Balneolaceae bacterium]|nr:MAG: SPOR domain-containing protein [Balneolaceae bacterium]
MTHFLTSIFVIIVLVSGCATTADVREREEPAEAEAEVETVLDLSTTDALDLDSYRSRLDDQFSYIENEIPDVFRTSENDLDRIKGNHGFRIQLVSTNDKQLADSLALSFDMWADTADVAQRPVSYIQFRQPAYRVHVGDFMSRRVAIEYLGVIRRFFPGSWIVHDTINTESVIQ